MGAPEYHYETARTACRWLNTLQSRVSDSAHSCRSGLQLDLPVMVPCRFVAGLGGPHAGSEIQTRVCDCHLGLRFQVYSGMHTKHSSS